MCAGKGVLAVYENFGHVAECECGTIQVTVGPVSVALDAQALRRLHDLLGAAIEKVEAGELAQPKPLLLHSSHLALKKVLKIKR
jgi:hypothetical protein